MWACSTSVDWGIWREEHKGRPREWEARAVRHESEPRLSYCSYLPHRTDLTWTSPPILDTPTPRRHHPPIGETTEPNPQAHKCAAAGYSSPGIPAVRSAAEWMGDVQQCSAATMTRDDNAKIASPTSAISDQRWDRKHRSEEGEQRRTGQPHVDNR
jgi:hypothetical protein